MKITAESGSSFDAYVSTQGANPRPGLIICSEAFGVNSHMRSVADRFASHGYLAVVPDLLWRIEPGIKITYNEAGLRRASEIAEIFDKDIGAEDVQRTLDQVCQRGDFNGKVGVLGFCIGGAVAYLAAARSNIDACIAYYGKGIEQYLDEAEAISCPTVLHYAGADRFIPPSVIADVRRAVTSKGNFEVFEYLGVDHGFNSEDRRAYNPDAAKLAMERTLNALSRGLHVGRG
jgi:carboxymethylenebutenolidase